MQGRRSSGPCRVGRRVPIRDAVARCGPNVQTSTGMERNEAGCRHRSRHGLARWPAASRRRGAGCSPANRPRRGSRISTSPTSPARSPRRSRAATRADAFNPDDWMEPKEQRRVDDFIVYAMARRDPGAARRRLGAQDLRGGDRDRRPDRLGHRRPGGIYDASITLHEKGPRRISPFFIPGRLINLVERPCFDRPQAQGPEPRRRHRLFDRRARDRRRGAAHRARRRQRDGRGRRRIGGQPPVARGLRRLPGAVDRFQRPAASRPRAPMTATATAS